MTVKTKTLFLSPRLDTSNVNNVDALKSSPTSSSLPSFLSPRPLSRSLCEQKNNYHTTV